MVKISTAVSTRQRKKKVLKAAKGQFGKRSTNIRQAQRSITKGLAYQYRDRKVRKREFRRLWIIRINAACQEEGITYSRFINGLLNAKIGLDRKVMAELAVSEPEAFKKLVAIVRN